MRFETLFRVVMLNCIVPRLNRDNLTVIGEDITAVTRGICCRAEGVHFHVLGCQSHVNGYDGLQMMIAYECRPRLS